MTEKERLWTGIAVSLFAHFVALTTQLPNDPARHTVHTVVNLNVSSSARALGNAPGLGVDALPPQDEKEANAADMRRRAFLEYLDAVDDAVHAHRLDGGETGLLGVATCSFIIGRDGAFSDIELFSSSGHPELDNAALRAVQAASGRVQRPAIIGQEPIPVVLDVKYQYGLH